MFFWPCIMNWLYINYQLHALIIIYSYNAILLYMFRTSSAHLQESIVVYKQHMVPSLSIRVLVACWYAAIAAYQQAARNSHTEWQYHMLLVYNYVLLKMSTWCSKHVEESNILRINNSHCIKLVINVQIDRPPGTLIESDGTICCLYTTMSSWRWALDARNM